MIKLYELVTKQGGVSFSPFVIAAELFLKHKNLEFESIPLTFFQIGPTISKITNGEWQKVPTAIFPNGDIVFDSPMIAQYLDEHYPDNPIDLKEPDLDELIADYNENVAPSAFKLALLDLYESLDEADQRYFKETREERFNKPLNQIPGDRETNINAYLSGTERIAKALTFSTYLDGNKPGLHDYILISRIQFFRTVSPSTYEALIKNHPSDEFKRWIKAMDTLFGGYLKTRRTH